MVGYGVVPRYAAEFADTPRDSPAGPANLTLQQSAALLKASHGTRIGAYIAPSPGTGIRTEEARARTGKPSTSATHRLIPRAQRASPCCDRSARTATPNTWLAGCPRPAGLLTCVT